MKNTKTLGLMLLASGIVALIAACASQMGIEPSTGAAVRIDNDDIGGVVTSAKGPEAGVWVIAETKGLPTRFAKMVVTDDRGRYVIPDLPKATFDIWVRGYGLVDSPKVKATPGKILNLKAVVAPNDAAAAEYYPAIHWYSMMKIPTRASLTEMGKPARSDPKSISEPDEVERLRQLPFDRHARHAHLSPECAIPYGQVCQFRGSLVSPHPVGTGRSADVRITKDLVPRCRYLADWTDRVAKGELPHTKPTRPQGAERNIVVTTWDWLDDKHYLHDLIASDRRFPTVNAYGPVYGSTELSVDVIPILDPKTHSTKNFGTCARRRYT